MVAVAVGAVVGGGAGAAATGAARTLAGELAGAPAVPPAGVGVDADGGVGVGWPAWIVTSTCAPPVIGFGAGAPKGNPPVRTAYRPTDVSAAMMMTATPAQPKRTIWGTRPPWRLPPVQETALCEMRPAILPFLSRAALDITEREPQESRLPAPSQPKCRTCAVRRRPAVPGESSQDSGGRRSGSSGGRPPASGPPTAPPVRQLSSLPAHHPRTPR